MVDYRASAIATVVATAALIPVAMLPLLARTVRRYGRLRGWPMLAALGLLGASVALAAYTVLPLPDAGDLQCTGGSLSSYWILDPRASTVPMLDALRDHGLLAIARDPYVQQFFLNVLLFVPFGFLLHQVTRWGVVAASALGFLTSLGIELTQGSAFFGTYPCPYRTFDVADLVANTGGAMIGAVLSAAVVAAVPAVTPRPVPDLEPPTPGRRGVAVLIDAGVATMAAAGAVGALSLARGLAGGSEPALEVIGDRGDWALALLAGTALVAVVHPLLRRDRATLGHAVVNVGPARTADPARHGSAAQVLVRWLVRWVPVAVAFALGTPWIEVIAVAEIACVALTARRESLAGLASRTSTRTLPSLRQSRTAASRV
ncbi:VanZ family protein, partial [Demequina sp.]|uniref:VanZ family protein n=1 Tax=Demequina sp. TaxID=2050685 RepID=UPI0025E41EB3